MTRSAELTRTALDRNIGSQITPFASRTFQYTKEQLGQAEDKVCGRTLISRDSQLTELDQQTQLPPDYIDLEKRVDALKQVHQKMLGVTYVPQPPADLIFDITDT